MSLYKWFFPIQAQAARLNELDARLDRGRKQEAKNQGNLQDRIDQLEQNQGVMALVLAGLMDKLDENGTIARGELEAAMEQLDGFDGIRDGKIPVSVLRQLAGNADSDVAQDLKVEDGD